MRMSKKQIDDRIAELEFHLESNKGTIKRLTERAKYLEQELAHANRFIRSLQEDNEDTER